MALNTDQKASKVFKKWIGVGETSTSRDFFEEPRRGRPTVLPEQVWLESSSIPIPAGSVPGITTQIIDLSLTPVSGTTNAFYHANLIDAIPFNYDPLGSYNFTLKDDLDNLIPFGQGDWVVDSEAGVLTFYGTVPANMPPKISFYRYIGTKGVGTVTYPGGNDTNIQYNDSSVFGGSDRFTWNDTDLIMNVDTNTGLGDKVMIGNALDTSVVVYRRQPMTRQSVLRCDGLFIDIPGVYEASFSPADGYGMNVVGNEVKASVDTQKADSIFYSYDRRDDISGSLLTQHGVFYPTILDLASEGTYGTVSLTGTFLRTDAFATNNCVTFDGATARGEVPSHTALNMNYLVIESWIKGTFGAGSAAFVSRNQESVGNQFFEIIFTSDSDVDVNVWDESDVLTKLSLPITTVLDDAWHHFAVIIGSDYVDVYVDGQYSNGDSWTGPLKTIGTCPIDVGAHYDGAVGSLFLNASLDELRYYAGTATSLLEDEARFIDIHYNDGFGTYGIVSEWAIAVGYHFDETVGATATNYSSLVGLDMTLSGSYSWNSGFTQKTLNGVSDNIISVGPPGRNLYSYYGHLIFGNTNAQTFMSGSSVSINTASLSPTYIFEFGRFMVMNASHQSLFGFGDASAPGISFNNDKDTGFYRPASNNIAVALNGAEFIRVTPTTVGIGTAIPDASAILDLTSTTLGFLMPRMTTAQRIAIVSPADGLWVYDLTEDLPYYYDGSDWVQVGTSATAGGWTDDGGVVRLTTVSDQVGIGITVPHAKAKVDITSTTSGLLIPRLTNAQILALFPMAPTAYGMLVYNNEDYKLQVLSEQTSAFIDVGPTGWTIDYSNSVIQLQDSGYMVGIGTLSSEAGDLDTALHVAGDNAAADAPLVKFWASNDHDMQSQIYLPTASGATTWEVDSNSASVGSLVLRYQGDHLASFGSSGSVFNDDAVSTFDFRVGGGTDANTLFVDSSSDNVGFGTNVPEATAKVEIASTSQGFLLPRMTTVQKNAIVSPASALIVFDTDLGGLNYYNGVAWVGVADVTTGDINLGGGYGAGGVTISSTGTIEMAGKLTVDGEIDPTAIGLPADAPIWFDYDSGINKQVRMYYDTSVVDEEALTIDLGNSPMDGIDFKIKTGDTGFFYVGNPSSPDQFYLSTEEKIGRLLGLGVIDGIVRAGGFSAEPYKTLYNASASLNVGNNGAVDERSQEENTWYLNRDIGRCFYINNIGTAEGIGVTVVDADTIGFSTNGKVGVGTFIVDDSAILEMSSTAAGFLPPRMTTIQRDAIGTPASGLTLYDTDENRLSYYNGAAWAYLAEAGALGSYVLKAGDTMIGPGSLRFDTGASDPVDLYEHGFFWNLLASEASFGFTNTGVGGTVRVSVDGRISVADGTCGTPSISFTSDDDVGIFRYGANELGLTAGLADGSTPVIISGSGLKIKNPRSISFVDSSENPVGDLTPRNAPDSDIVATGKWSFNDDIYMAGINSNIVLAAGSTAAPSLTFNSDLDTGMYWAIGNKIAFSCNNSERMVISSTEVTINDALIIYDATATSYGYLTIGNPIGFNCNIGLVSVPSEEVIYSIGGETGTARHYFSENVYVNGTITSATGFYGDGANVTGVVHTSGNETVGGVKTFTSTAQFQHASAIELGKDDTPNIAGSMVLWSAGTNNYYTQITAGTQTIGNINYTLPTTQAAGTNYLLANDGSGALSWLDPNTITLGPWHYTGAANYYLYPDDYTNARVCLGVNSQPGAYNSVLSIVGRASGNYPLVIKGTAPGVGTTPLTDWIDSTNAIIAQVDYDGSIITTARLEAQTSIYLLETAASPVYYTIFQNGDIGSDEGANITYTLPTGQGNAGSLLSNDGTGALSWTSSVLKSTSVSAKYGAVGYAVTMSAETYAAATAATLGPIYLYTFRNTVVGGDVGDATAWQWIVPNDRVTSSDITIRIHWISADATAGNVKWMIADRHANEGSAYSPQTVNVHTSALAAAPGTAYGHVITTLTIPGTGINNRAHLLIIIGRDGEDATDTYAADVYISDIEILYESDKLGE